MPIWFGHEMNLKRKEKAVLYIVFESNL